MDRGPQAPSPIGAVRPVGPGEEVKPLKCAKRIEIEWSGDLMEWVKRYEVENNVDWELVSSTRRRRRRA